MNVLWARFRICELFQILSVCHIICKYRIFVDVDWSHLHIYHTFMLKDVLL